MTYVIVVVGLMAAWVLWRSTSVARGARWRDLSGCRLAPGQGQIGCPESPGPTSRKTRPSEDLQEHSPGRGTGPGPRVSRTW